MSHDFDDFLPFISPYAVGAPEPLVFNCLRDAAVKFCTRTRLWRDTDTIITNGAYPEPINVPQDSVLMEIVNCGMECRPIKPISLDDLARIRPTWRTDPLGCGSPEWFVCPEFGSVQGVPRSAGTLTIEFVAVPSADCTTLPDFLYDYYVRDIADGASGAVLLMPDQEFANPTLGAGLLQRFESRLDELSTAGRRGQQRASARSRGRFF
jgi:hypothetical protein